MILADNVNQFKNRLDKRTLNPTIPYYDKHWKMHEIVFIYRTDFAETGGLA